MRNTLLISFLFAVCTSLYGQNNIKKTAGIAYTQGPPTYTVNTNTSAEYAVDTVTSKLYWYSRNGSTWVLYPRGFDIVAGAAAPAYTPRDNQSLFAINGDNELYYYTGASWVQVGGSGGGGIYGGDGTTGTAFTTATIDSILRFLGDEAHDRFIAAIAGGTDVSGMTAIDTASYLYYDDPGGTNQIEANNEGVSITTIASDRVTISGADTRYNADYSATFSARSLVDKGYVDGALSGEVSIPDGEVAFGNGTSDGITSSSTLTYDGDVLTNDAIQLEGSSGTITGKDATLQDLGASSSTSGGTLTIANFDGAALTSGHRMGLLQFSGNTGIGGTGIGASIRGFAGATWTGTSSPGELRIFTTPSGTLTEKERVRITRTGVTQLRNGGFLDFYNAADGAVMEMGATDSILYLYGLGSQEESEFAFQGKIGLFRQGSVALTAHANNLYLGCGGGVVAIGSSAAYNITGMQANIGASSARLLFAVNASNYTITLVDESASSLAANRFDLDGVNYSWAAGEVLMLLYEDARDRWTIPNRPSTSALTYETNAPATIRPAQITATQNDYNPTGYSTTVSQVIQVDGDANFQTITGLKAATRDGVEKTFDNDGTNCYVLAKKHTGSSAANRFDIPRDIVMLPGMAAKLRYDSVGAVWRAVSTTGNEISFSPQFDISTKDDAIMTTSVNYNGSANGGTITRSSAGTFFTRSLNLNTSTAATAYPTVLAFNGMMTLLTNKTYIRRYGKIRLEDLSTAAEDFDVRFGFMAMSGVDTTANLEGAWVEYRREENSGGWTLKTHDGTTLTTTNCGSAIAADTWYNIELVFYPYGEVVVFLDGTRYATTTTVPNSGNQLWFVQNDKDNGTASRTVYVGIQEEKWVYVTEQ